MKRKMMLKMGQDELNPYVGPRPFERSKEDSARFFGRVHETEEITSLIYGHRITLVYAQSGAGKTSLFNASIIPELEKNGFEVQPLTRVGGVIPEGVDIKGINNLYMFNVLLKMAPENSPQSLTLMSLSEYLESRVRMTDENGQLLPRAIIFDQFEELFTYTPEDWREQRKGFFHQIIEALDTDPLLRVVFVIREDFLAQLDPYARDLPDRLRIRYRLERLGEHAALRAIKDPLANTSRKFARGVAEGLVKQLLTTRSVDAAGQMAEIEGQYVEPVQLQVVCVTLWSALKPEVTEIERSHLKDFDVNDALSDFYESTIEDASKKTGVKEANLRNWFGKTLITSMGTRSTVFRGEDFTGSIDNNAVDLLESRHIIRAEFRAGARWYELTHDRLVEPILSSNQKWFETLSPLQRQAALWNEQNRNASWLLTDQVLAEVEEWAKANADELTEVENDFLAACQNHQQQIINDRERQQRELQMAQKLADEQARYAQEQAQANLRISKALRTSTIIAGIASLLLVAAILLGIQSNKNQRNTQMQVLLNASSIEFQKDENLGILLAYQALKQFGDHGEVEQAVANVIAPMQERKSTQTPFVLSNTKYGVGSIAFSPINGGKILAAGYTDGNIYLIDMTTRTPLGKPLTGHTANVTSLSFSPDGKMLASGSEDGTVILWDVASQELVGELQGDYYSRVTSVTFNPEDGKILASGSEDGTVLLWDVANLEPIGEPLTGYGYYVAVLAFSPDGKILAYGSDSQIPILWDVASQEPIGEPSGEYYFGLITSLAFSPDGKTLAFGSDFGGPILWDVASQEPIGEPQESNGYRVFSVAFSPDGNLLVSGSEDGTVILWDVASQKPIGEPLEGSPNTVTSVVFSPDGRALAASDGTESKIIFWDVVTRELEDPINARIQKDATLVEAMSIASDDNILGIAENDIKLWDGVSLIESVLEMDKPLYHRESIAHSGDVYALSPDGMYRVNGSTNNVGTSYVEVLNLETNEEVIRVSHESTVSVRAVAFSQDGTTVASADDNTVRIWDAKNGRQVARIKNDMSSSVKPVSVSFSPDTKRIVIAFNDNQSTVEVWDIKSRQKILLIANRQLQPLGYTVVSSTNLFNGSANGLDEPEQAQNEQVGNPVADVAYLENGLIILYNNGIVDYWDMWPSRDDLKKDAEEVCGTCELTPAQRVKYDLYTWPMRVHDYAGYLIIFFNILIYGFGALRIYHTVFEGPITTDQNASPGFTRKKFLSASTLGMALTLIGLLGWVGIGYFETIIYGELAREPVEIFYLLIWLVLPLGMWAGGVYSYLTQRQSGKWSRTKRSLNGMLAGFLGGLFAGLLIGLISSYYGVEKDLFETLGVYDLMAVSIFAGTATGLLSFLGGLIYIFVLHPLSEGKKMNRETLVVLQLLFGIGMFFAKKEAKRKWIYPIAVLAMTSFWLLEVIDLDYNYLGRDIISDDILIRLGIVGLVTHLFGLYDLGRALRYKDRGTASVSLFGALSSHFFLGIGLFYVESKSLRKWFYPAALLFVLIGFADLDYTLLGFDIMPNEAAGIVGVLAFVVYLAGFFDTWRIVRRINKVQTPIRVPWKRGLFAVVVAAILTFVIIYIDQGRIDPGSDGFAIIIFSVIFGMFGLVFYPHKSSYIIMVILGGVFTSQLYPGLDSLPVSLWFGFGSGFILSAIISRILHAIKVI